MKLIKEQVITFRLPVPVTRDLDQAATLAGLSRSQLLRRIVEQAIEDLGIKQRYTLKSVPAEQREIEPLPGKSQRETLETIYAVMLAQAEQTRKQLESLDDQPTEKDPEHDQGAD